MRAIILIFLLRSMVKTRQCLMLKSAAQTAEGVFVQQWSEAECTKTNIAADVRVKQLVKCSFLSAYDHSIWRVFLVEK